MHTITLASTLLPEEAVNHLDTIWLQIAFKILIVAVFFLGGVSLIAMFSIWWERKVAGHIQGRVGPMHTGAWHGWAQSLADGIKLIQKEDLIPEGADQFLYRLAPYLAFAPVFAAFVALPFGPQLCFEGGLSNGVLYIFAVLAVEVMAVILAGWGSNSKWAIYGAMREACQLVSYEVPLGVTLLCGVLVAGTLNMVELGYLQGAGIWDWYFYHNPFTFIAFFVFFVATLAENKRAPFDLPESESELVAGFHTEYSGLRFSFFFFAEYAGMFVMAVVTAFVFLGGWNSPLGVIDPIYWFLGYDPVAAGVGYFDGSLANADNLVDTAKAMGLAETGNGVFGSPGWLTVLAVNGYGMVWVVLKAFSLVFVQIWLRWTLPRIRIDQVMYACVKVLLPMSLILITGTAIWVALVPQPQPSVEGLPLRVGHLAGTNPYIQVATQAVLTAAGLAISAAVGLVVIHAFVLSRGSHPKKSMFEDVMPVGKEISFTTYAKPEADDDAEGGATPAPA